MLDNADVRSVLSTFRTIFRETLKRPPNHVMEGTVMNATVEQSLISKIKTLSPQQVAEVEDFVEFLAAKSKKRAAIDRLLAIAPALAEAGVEPMSEEEIAAEVAAARAERRAKLTAKEAGADRS